MSTRRPIPDYPGYEATDTGEVWSLRRGPLRKLTGTPNHNGYLTVSLSVDNRPVHRTIHQLVALAFIGPRPTGLTINHRDGDKRNNRPENLEYVTDRENHRHAVAMGLKPKGEKIGTSKLTAAQVAEAWELRSQGMSYRQLGSLLGVHKETVREALIGRYWKHLGLPPHPTVNPCGSSRTFKRRVEGEG